MPLQVAVELKFCAAHRLVHHTGKCAALHGHNYRVEVLLQSPAVVTDRSGMVVDFADVKREIGGFIDQNWDHNAILNPQDPMLWENESLTDPGTPLGHAVLARRFGRVPFVFPLGEPTAEMLALFLMRQDWKFLRNGPVDQPRRPRLVGVRVWETDSCSALVGE